MFLIKPCFFTTPYLPYRRRILRHATSPALGGNVPTENEILTEARKQDATAGKMLMACNFIVTITIILVILYHFSPLPKDMFAAIERFASMTHALMIGGIIALTAYLNKIKTMMQLFMLEYNSKKNDSSNGRRLPP